MHWSQQRGFARPDLEFSVAVAIAHAGTLAEDYTDHTRRFRRMIHRFSHGRLLRPHGARH
jgi:hypothetical protein